MQFKCKQCRRGVTLLELVLAMGILAALMGVILPAVGAARIAAQRTVCASNMRSIGQALASYCVENRGRFPESTHSAALQLDRAWIYTLAKHLGDIDRVRISPADPRGEQRLANKGSSYVLNEYITVAGTDETLSMQHVRRPSETMTVLTASDRMSVTTFGDHTHSRNWFRLPTNAWNRILADIQPDRHGGNASRVAGSANYLFADGHVESIAAATIKTYADTNTNFIRPPQ
jgi:prepilin-type processing-associated H-X9-DG protein